jgi:ABC-type antimicrobial peptide transport system permease subunit
LNVVGVIKDINSDGLDQAGTPHIYTPFYQSRNIKSMSLALKTSLPATSLQSKITQEIQAIDPGLPVVQVRTMDEIIDKSLADHRFSAELVGGFAILGLVLASVGIYGLLAYMVGQRSHEIGVRMALGAQPSAIGKMIVGQGAVLAGAGVLVGLVLAGILAVIFSPWIASQLYRVHPVDPTVFAAVPLILMVVALLASYVPARRAARVDPIVALRES